MMERLPVLLLACCAAHRARAEGGVRLADLDWAALTAAVAEGRTISDVRACSAVQRGAARCGVARCGVVRCDAVQCSAA